MALVDQSFSSAGTKNQASDRNTDGLEVGYSATDTVGFFGADPVVQQTTATFSDTTVAISTGTIWGFASSTQANTLTKAVVAIKLALDTLGLTA
jgi:hypothetical protein